MDNMITCSSVTVTRTGATFRSDGTFRLRPEYPIEAVDVISKKIENEGCVFISSSLSSDLEANSRFEATSDTEIGIISIKLDPANDDYHFREVRFEFVFNSDIEYHQAREYSFKLFEEFENLIKQALEFVSAEKTN